MYFYKTKDKKCVMCLGIEVDDPEVIEITEDEWLKYSNNTENEQVINIVDFYKKKLSATDYIAIKYAEGILSEEEYLPIKNQRIEWRNAINDLQNN